MIYTVSEFSDIYSFKNVHWHFCFLSRLSNRDQIFPPTWEKIKNIYTHIKMVMFKLEHQEFRTVVFEKRETRWCESSDYLSWLLRDFQATAEEAGTQVDSSTLPELRSQSQKPRRPKQLEVTGQSITEIENCKETAPEICKWYPPFECSRSTEQYIWIKSVDCTQGRRKKNKRSGRQNLVTPKAEDVICSHSLG